MHSHTIKLSSLLLLTIRKFCVLSKNSVGYFKINGVHKVHVCVVVYNVSSFVSCPESVENNSLKPTYSLKYTFIYFYSENLIEWLLCSWNDYTFSSMTRNKGSKKKNHFIRNQQFVVIYSRAVKFHSSVIKLLIVSMPSSVRYSWLYKRNVPGQQTLVGM